MHFTSAVYFFMMTVFGIVTSHPNQRGHSNMKGMGRHVTFTDNQKSGSKMDPSGFPEQLQYTMHFGDMDTVELDLQLDRSMAMPPSMSRDTYGRFREQPRYQGEMAFYTDKNGHGTFACKVRSRGNGRIFCDITGIIHMANETCFLGTGSTDADCTEVTRTQGILENYEVPNATVSNTSNPSRAKRNTPLPQPGYKVVEVLFIVDAAFMQPFYDRNANTQTAQEEAEVFITLLSNEMNVYYQSFKTVSNGALDIYVYPAAFVHPDPGTDWSWVQQNKLGNSLFAGDATDNGLRADISSGLTSVSWDHAMAIVGLDLYTNDGNLLLGYAYRGTMCSNTPYKYSLLEYTAQDLGLIAAHELGHALGIYHDGNTPNPTCPAARNIMSPSLFSISGLTINTYHTFSVCSVNNAIDYLNSQPDCTGTHGFTDLQFQQAFCAGQVGTQDNTLDKQCQRVTRWSGSYACNSVQGSSGCFSSNYVQCRTSSDTGTTCSGRLRFVWNGTPCGANMICYKGLCQNQETPCAGLSSTSSPSSSASVSTSPSSTPSTSTSSSTTSTTPSTLPTSSTTSSSTTTMPSAPCSCCHLTYSSWRLRYCCAYALWLYREVCYACYNLDGICP